MRQALSDLRLDIAMIQRDRKFCEGLALAYLQSVETAERRGTRQNHNGFCCHKLSTGGSARNPLGRTRRSGEAIRRSLTRLRSPPHALCSDDVRSQQESKPRRLGYF